MPKLALVALLAAACGNQDNLIVGGIAAGATTPDVIFDNIGSSIHGTATLRDVAGNPVGGPLGIVIMSDRPGLCSILHAHPDYFRNAPESYEALIMVFDPNYVGTFMVGRGGTDVNTSSELVAASGPQTTTPFHAINGSYFAVTDWSSTGGSATGSFNMAFDDPYGGAVAHPFYGKFKTSFCPGLEGTLLP